MSATDAPRRQNRGPAAGPGNRRALIAAAREIFATEGPGVPFTAVAKRAGVGQGTLYRHFPDRIALAVAVFEDNMTELEEGLQAQGTVAELLDRIVEQATSSAAFIRLLIANGTDGRTAEITKRFDALVTTLTERDRAAGLIGAHVEPADVAIAMSMLTYELAAIPEPDRAPTAQRARRLFDTAFAPR